MRGKKRTKKEQHELFSVIELYLEMGYSLKKSCKLANIPYSTVRDTLEKDELLRAKYYALKNKVSVKARENIIKAIENGSVAESKWWFSTFGESNDVDDIYTATMTTSENRRTLAEAAKDPGSIKIGEVLEVGSPDNTIQFCDFSKPKT